MLNSMTLRDLLLLIVPMLLALTVHELAHGWVAYKLGDNTAKQAGRLTFNPIAHLDPVGALFFVLSGFFGWAKPVPVSPRNFKNPSRDMAIVSLAGPFSNLMLALVWFLATKLAFSLGFFSMFSPDLMGSLINIFILGIMINISLAVFNLLPVPPLDGFRILAHFLPFRITATIFQYRFVWMLVLMVAIYNGVFSSVIWPLYRLVIGLLG